jgi:DNA-binding GntR family transcriptional regulator
MPAPAKIVTPIVTAVQPLADSVAARIREKVISGELSPGCRKWL